MEEFKNKGANKDYYYKEAPADYEFSGNGMKLTQNNYKEKAGNKHLIDLLAKDTTYVLYRFVDTDDLTILYYECHTNRPKDFEQYIYE